MKYAAYAMLLSLGLFTLGCTEREQLEDAQEDAVEERQDLDQAAGEAGADGVITGEEAEEITDEQGDVLEAEGDVIEQSGDVVEEESFN